jgi:hypothetical protein
MIEGDEDWLWSDERLLDCERFRNVDERGRD